MKYLHLIHYQEKCIKIPDFFNLFSWKESPRYKIYLIGYQRIFNKKSLEENYKDPQVL